MDSTKVAVALRNSLMNQTGCFSIDEDNQFLLYDDHAKMTIDCLELADAVKIAVAE